jgi:hypothetical protein
VLAVLPLASVAFVVEFDVEQVDGAVEALEARQLLGDVDAEVVGNLDVAALDDDLGAWRGYGCLVLDDHGRLACLHGIT